MKWLNEHRAYAFVSLGCAVVAVIGFAWMIFPSGHSKADEYKMYLNYLNAKPLPISYQSCGILAYDDPLYSDPQFVKSEAAYMRVYCSDETLTHMLMFAHEKSPDNIHLITELSNLEWIHKGDY